MNELSSLTLLGRYLSFLWMFETVPARAPLLVRAAIVRRNRDRGLRFLPVYMRRYASLLAASWFLGAVVEVAAAPLQDGAAPLVVSAFFTCSTLSAVALLVAGAGFVGMRLRLYDHSRF